MYVKSATFADFICQSGNHDMIALVSVDDNVWRILHKWSFHIKLYETSLSLVT